MLAVFFFFHFFCWQCELWPALHHGHCIIPACGANSKPVANNSFWRSKTHDLWDIFSASLPTQVITHPRLLERRLEGSSASFRQNSVMQNHSPVSLRIPMAGGFGFLAHGWDSLNPWRPYDKGHFYQKAGAAGYILRCVGVRILLIKGPACVLNFTGWFKKSDIKTRNAA